MIWFRSFDTKVTYMKHTRRAHGNLPGDGVIASLVCLADGTYDATEAARRRPLRAKLVTVVGVLP